MSVGLTIRTSLVGLIFASCKAAPPPTASAPKLSTAKEIIVTSADLKDGKFTATAGDSIRWTFVASTTSVQLFLENKPDTFTATSQGANLIVTGVIPNNLQGSATVNVLARDPKTCPKNNSAEACAQALRLSSDRVTSFRLDVLANPAMANSTVSSVLGTNANGGLTTAVNGVTQCQKTGQGTLKVGIGIFAAFFNPWAAIPMIAQGVAQSNAEKQIQGC